MPKVTNDQVECAYIVASQVFDKEMSAPEGAKLLHQRDGINLASASDYIYDFKQMMNGTVFKRAMSAYAIDLFLSRIRDSRSHVYYLKSIQSVRLHIEYYEGLGKGRLLKMRRVVDQHTAALRPQNDSELFYNDVKKSLADPSDRRLARLEKADSVPSKKVVTMEVYVRNPDIVAEALLRANGTCEQCHSRAPFRRRSDGSPYLEVHHICPLSLGGKDILDNVVALCPNCHREQHYGIPSQIIASS